MKRLIPVSASAALIGILGAATAAHATAPVVAPQLSFQDAPDAPSQCQGRDAAQFRSGFSIGVRTVNQAVSRVDDCDQIDNVTDIVFGALDRLSLPPNASNRLACRFLGIHEGALAELDNQNFACEDECTADGADFGKVAAELYCDLSIFFGGLESPDPLFRQPVNTCGLFYEISCDTQFVDTSLGFVDLAGESCEPFTEGEFEEVWVESRANQCAYDPAVGPQKRDKER